MEFVTAFILGGLICLAFQIFSDFTKIPVPFVLIGGIALGAILAPFGIADALLKFGGAGFSITVVGAGQAIFGTTQALLAGVPAPFLAILVLFAVLVAIGIAAYLVRKAIVPHKSEKA